MHKQFLSMLVENIVEYPEAVVVTESKDDMGILLTLELHKNDMGILIGREGNTIKAIRTLVRVSGMKHGARISIKVLEPDGNRTYTAG